MSYEIIKEAAIELLHGASWSEEKRSVMIEDLVDMTEMSTKECGDVIQELCREEFLAEYHSDNFNEMMVTFYGQGHDWK